MNKTALIANLAEELGVSKKASGELLDALLKNIMKEVKKEGKFRIHGFGTFKRLIIKGRTGYFPRNPEKKITLKDTIKVNFKPGSEFKDMIK